MKQTSQKSRITPRHPRIANAGFRLALPIADIYRQRVLKRGKGSEVWGWGTAYGKPDQKAASAGAKS